MGSFAFSQENARSGGTLGAQRGVRSSSDWDPKFFTAERISSDTLKKWSDPHSPGDVSIPL